MIRRLAAMLLLGLALTACEAKRPEVAKTPPAKAAASGPTIYKAARSATLAAVRKRGYVRCGVHPSLPGFAFPDVRGQWRGFDVDVCRAVAAATLADATKVRFTTVDAQDRFRLLKAGALDVLSRNTSRTFARDAGLGVTFPVVTYFDGQ